MNKLPCQSARHCEECNKAGNEFVYNSAQPKQKYFNAACRKRNESAQKQSQSSPPKLKPVKEQITEDRKLHKLQEEKSRLEKLYKKSLKETNLHEEILEAAKETLTRIPPVKIVTPKTRKSHTVEDAILGWADWHGGEVVDYEVMQGLNHYDSSIMKRRAQTTVDSTLDLLFENHVGTKFENLYVFDLGDSITGDLLDDNKLTNDTPVFESMAMVADIKSRALCELATHIPVIYVGVPGNHGRRFAKMAWKLPTETADWLIYHMIKIRVEQNPRITCLIPKAWTTVINIRGHNHSLNHGYAAAKGGYGGISFYAFMRKDGLNTAIEASQGKYIDYRWYGHVHQDAKLPKMGGKGEQFIIPSLKGGDEYAYNELSSNSKPMQYLAGCHEKRGVTFRYPLEVTDNDDKISRYED